MDFPAQVLICGTVNPNLSLHTNAKTDMVAPMQEDRHEGELGRNRSGGDRALWLRSSLVHSFLQALAGGHPHPTGRIASLHGPSQLLALHYLVSVQSGHGAGHLLG